MYLCVADRLEPNRTLYIYACNLRCRSTGLSLQTGQQSEVRVCVLVLRHEGNNALTRDVISVLL